METKIDTVDKVVVVRASGEIDLNNSPQFRGVLKDALKTDKINIAIDLTNVSYMDSSGLATLVEALQKVKKTERKLALFSLTTTVKNIFSISRLDEIFPIYSSESEALKELAK